MCNGPIEGLCLRPDLFYVCECLFDEMVKIKFSQVRCHEEILLFLTSLTNRSKHLYSVSLASLRQRAILCTSCAGAFMIMADGKRICSHFKAELNIDEKIRVSYCVKCLAKAISGHSYILPHVVM